MASAGDGRGGIMGTRCLDASPAPASYFLKLSRNSAASWRAVASYARTPPTCCAAEDLAGHAGALGHDVEAEHRIAPGRRMRQRAAMDRVDDRARVPSFIRLPTP